MSETITKGQPIMGKTTRIGIVVTDQELDWLDDYLRAETASPGPDHTRRALLLKLAQAAPKRATK